MPIDDLGPRVRGYIAPLLSEAPAWQALLAFRIGYSTHEGLRSPRRAVNEVVKP